MAWDGPFDLPAHWPEVRRRVLRRDVLCQICGVEKATTVDHIRNRASSTRDWSKIRLNDHVKLCQGLCQGCHNRKTAWESAAAKKKVRERMKRPAARHPGMLGT